MVPRLVPRILLGSLLAVLLLVAFALAYRAWRQSAGEAAAKITTPAGIDEAQFVIANGSEQWVTIRGVDRSNPVLLIIDGGPGAATSPLIPSPWEKHFIVAAWDQPGAGRSFGHAGRKIDAGLSIQDVARSGEDVARYLRTHLHKQKIGLLAVSWGTLVGVQMVKQHPELFYAYVGTGQLVNMRRGEALSYTHVLQKARAKGDRSAVAELERIGPPPYDSQRKMGVERKWATTYEAGVPSILDVTLAVATAPRYGLGDVYDWADGFLASQDHFLGPTMHGPFVTADIDSLGDHFAVPMFVFQGKDDDFAPYELAKRWFDSLSAPRKMFVTVAGAGHYAFMTHEADLREFLDRDVRRLGQSAR